jgi:hypothetical protein
LFIASWFTRSKSTIKLLKNYVALQKEIEINPTKTTLEKAIISDFSLLVSLLFNKLGCRPTQAHLELAKRSEAMQTGLLILRYLGITGPRSIISTTGITHTLTGIIPQEIGDLIATYTLY